MSTVTLEQSVKLRAAVPRAEFQQWRRYVDDKTRVETLDREFPYIAQELGTRASNCYFMNAADNIAGTYKWRGAMTGVYYEKIAGTERVVIASAGNHAHGGALAGRRFNIQTDIYVPENAPQEKFEAVKRHWPNGKLTVTKAGQNFTETQRIAEEIANQDPRAAFVHPFDSEATVAGQGTMADDIVNLFPEVEQVVLPSGGNGASAGIATRFHELGRHDVSVYAAQAENSESLSRSLEAGYPVSVQSPNRKFGGVAVSKVGAVPFDYTSRLDTVHPLVIPTADVQEVAETYIIQNDVLERKAIPMFEPTSLLAVAALQQLDLSKRTLVIGTGTNQHPLAVFD